VALCAAELGATGRTARLLLIARSAGSVESSGAAAVSGRDLALTRRPAPQTLRARRRSLAADARTGRREVSTPAVEVGAQALVRPHHRHPGRRRPPLQRA